MVKITAFRNHDPWASRQRVAVVREGDGSAERLRESISRSKAAVLELALCNDWEWFITLTLDKAKRDRNDLAEYKRALSQWLRNYRRLRGAKVQYLLVPEAHKDGAWHIHGLLRGLPESHLTKFDPAVHPLRLCERGFLNWPAYADKFGFCSLDRIKDRLACARYITKYVCKDLAHRADYGKHLYLCSQGLNRAVELARGSVWMSRAVEPDYSNDYVGIEWVPWVQQLDSGNPEIVELLLPPPKGGEGR